MAKKTISITKVEFSMWDDDRGYRCFYKYVGNSLGEYAWGITHLKTGNGKGGFASTAVAAEKEADRAIKIDIAAKRAAL